MFFYNQSHSISLRRIEFWKKKLTRNVVVIISITSRSKDDNFLNMDMTKRKTVNKENWFKFYVIEKLIYIVILISEF
jgi:hypothetical protein